MTFALKVARSYPNNCIQQWSQQCAENAERIDDPDRSASSGHYRAATANSRSPVYQVSTKTARSLCVSNPPLIGLILAFLTALDNRTDQSQAGPGKGLGEAKCLEENDFHDPTF